MIGRFAFPFTFLLLTVAVLHLSASAVVGQRRVLHYEPEKVTLTGRVVLRTFYGPPNYGENPKTDSKETQSILLLYLPVDVIGTADDPNMNETERKVTRITLVLNQP